MAKVKLSKERISELGSEFADFMCNNYLDNNDFSGWGNNDYLNFVEAHYEEFIQNSLSEGLIDESEKEYLITYDDDTDAYIKEDAIEEIKTFIKDGI